MNVKPKFPLRILFQESNDEWILKNENDAACTLEWFDSDDPNEHASVTDDLGRPVRLKVEGLAILVCEVAMAKNTTT